MAEGLRERKKRRTRQQISDVATGLFVARGFDAVTIAEIARAAEVSVNTVYNYFPAKEDLFFDRSTGVIDRLARWVRGRDPGESAAAAVLRELRAEVEAVSPRLGLMDGYADFMRVVEDSPALRSRLWAIGQEVHTRLEEALRAETGAEEGDVLPELMAGQINWLHGAVMSAISRGMVAGGAPAEVSRQVLVLIDEMEELLSERVLNYAVRLGN
ncbi:MULTISPECIES: TetR/AcrR family transcriptional regulator [Streptomyces]|uniref:TetR-family transcriptional regulator n=1 Tax=Streptomyces albus (strain ATCC 21838 / DSM 41398 / FERM P-419 / JCM 4703 / NBRC 107858) TaxID=1081613 RepID=A0A0B5EJ38_STRA4|nr:TetR/AcrR family transcriptional regulator [Streptomyces sp. SCSIO ZS0520]AJE82283.1 tetR-family transcriptional regulator [Streptomyces albus]AOU76599.1 tetR-family transcriptional regulator [Streptomyces albus]AYN32383.1 TetR/AcrR family transcriptional regulator [Streptomyces albus]